jgi:hypothetical protein
MSKKTIFKKLDEKQAILKRFEGILFFKLENVWKSKKHLIPGIKKDLKILNKTLTTPELKKELHHILKIRMNWEVKNRKDFLKLVCDSPQPKKTKSPKDKFKFVTGGGGPVQGGSPGLGKGKS